VDFAADKRAPTPTAAAEFAVPVRSQLLQTLQQYGGQLTTRLQHKLSLYESQLQALDRGFPPLGRILDDHTLKLDELLERLVLGQTRLIQQNEVTLDHLKQRLTPALQALLQQVSHKSQVLGQLLESYSYSRVLERGFTFITGQDDQLIPSKALITPHQKVQVHFYDGKIQAEILDKT
jgi:exodeoxyribonuclease VII large subunit